MHPQLVTLLRGTAADEGIGTRWRRTRVRPPTPTSSTAKARGIPTALVSIPLRRMHTAVETVQLSDLEDTVRLLVAFLRRLEPGLDLAR